MQQSKKNSDNYFVAIFLALPFQQSIFWRDACFLTINCQIKGIRLLVKWLRGQDRNHKTYVQPVLRLLDSMLAHKGDLQQQGCVRYCRKVDSNCKIFLSSKSEKVYTKILNISKSTATNRWVVPDLTVVDWISTITTCKSGLSLIVRVNLYTAYKTASWSLRQGKGQVNKRIKQLNIFIHICPRFWFERQTFRG